MRKPILGKGSRGVGGVYETRCLHPRNMDCRYARRVYDGTKLALGLFLGAPYGRFVWTGWPSGSVKKNLQAEVAEELGLTASRAGVSMTSQEPLEGVGIGVQVHAGEPHDTEQFSAGLHDAFVVAALESWPHESAGFVVTAPRRRSLPARGNLRQTSEPLRLGSARRCCLLLPRGSFPPR